MLTIKKKSKLQPLVWSSAILAVSQTLTLCIAFREKDFVESSQLISPQISLAPSLLYFLIVVVLMGVVLYFIPISKLRIVLRVIFAFLFSWGIFIVLGLSSPLIVASLFSVTGGLMWFLKPKIWLHNLLMILTLTGASSVFGFLLSPWTALYLMLALSVYDVLAVRFGFMLWLVKKMFESEALPAFIIPGSFRSWNLNLLEADAKRLFEDSSGDREFSILGGGDIGFPLFLVVSVFFTLGFASSVIIAIFSLLGLVSAYLIQMFFLKGKPMPALPPISLMSLVGFAVLHFTS